MWNGYWVNVVQGCHGVKNQQRQFGWVYYGVKKEFKGAGGVAVSVISLATSKITAVKLILVAAGVMGGTASYLQDHGSYYVFRQGIAKIRYV